MAVQMPAIEPLVPDTMEDLVQIYENAQGVLEASRSVMLAPKAEKRPPTFTVKQLCALCGLKRHEYKEQAASGQLPLGTKVANRRVFALPEARQWIKANRESLRPDGLDAATIAIGNFKGGVTKTTTTMSLAQGLSLRGYDVLVIDLDPQASLTNLFGLIPDSEVSEDQTALPVFTGEQESLRYAVSSSYWEGVDFVPATSQLFNTEFVLPSKQKGDPSFQFWTILDKALKDVRPHYDVILIDTAPALSYSTVNAFMAADGLIVPIPPSALDFASSVQFWSLFSDLAMGLGGRMKKKKLYDFTRVLFTRVDSADAAGTAVRSWIRQAYGDRVMDAEVPKSTVAMGAAAEFGTVYDIDRYDGNNRTYRRMRDAFDDVVMTVDGLLMSRWQTQQIDNETKLAVVSA